MRLIINRRFSFTEMLHMKSYHSRNFDSIQDVFLFPAVIIKVDI